MADGGCRPRQSPSTWHRGPRRKRSNGSHKRGLNTKIHLAVDAHGLSLRIHVTTGLVADYTQAVELVEGLPAGALIADGGYDTAEIIENAEEHGMEVIIPPKCNRKVQREYDKHVYRVRHLVENAFRTLKE